MACVPIRSRQQILSTTIALDGILSYCHIITPGLAHQLLRKKKKGVKGELRDSVACDGQVFS